MKSGARVTRELIVELSHHFKDFERVI